MSDTLHTYHPTKDGTRGIHAITTSDHGEAMTMLHAVRLREILENVSAHEGVIIDAAEKAFGHNAQYRALLDLCSQVTDGLAGVP